MGGTTSTGTAGEPWFAEVRRRHPDVDVVLLEPEPDDSPDDPARPQPAAADTRLVTEHCTRLSDGCAEAVPLPGLTAVGPRWVPGTVAGAAELTLAHAAVDVDETAARDALGSLAAALTEVGASPRPVPAGALALRAVVPTPVGAVQVSALHAAELARLTLTVTSPEVAVGPDRLTALVEGNAV